MTKLHVAAHTAVGGTYPAYASMNYDQARERVEILVRGSEHVDDMGVSPGFVANIELSPFDFRRLIENAAAALEHIPDPLAKAVPSEGRENG